MATRKKPGAAKAKSAADRNGPEARGRMADANAKPPPTPKGKTKATAGRSSGASISVTGRVLDARADRLDFRDLPYRPRLRSLAAIWPADEVIAANLGGYVSAGLVRDQGEEGACTGFGLACVANYLLWVTPANPGRSSHRVGQPAHVLPARAALRRMARRGLRRLELSRCAQRMEQAWRVHRSDCGRFRREGQAGFASRNPAGKRTQFHDRSACTTASRRASIVDIQAASYDIGAVYVSADAHDGWDALLKTRPGTMPTSHESLDNIREIATRSRRRTRVRPSSDTTTGFHRPELLGQRWGARGFAILRYEDWINNGTDAWVCALGVPVQPSEERLRLFTLPHSVRPALDTRGRIARNPKNTPDDPWPIDHLPTPDYKPWPHREAYQHTLVSGNDGVLMASDVTFGVDGRPGGVRDKVIIDPPSNWFASPAARRAGEAHDLRAWRTQQRGRVGPAYSCHGSRTSRRTTSIHCS